VNSGVHMTAMRLGLTRCSALKLCAIAFLLSVGLILLLGSTGQKAWAINTVASETPTPVFTADLPPSKANLGDTYSYVFAASGQPAPTFSLGSGTLPPGIGLDRAGLLSGVATEPGVFPFNVIAQNGAARGVSSATRTIVISAAPTFLLDAPPPATIDAPYFYAFTAVGTPAPTYAVAAGTLPAGLTLSAGGLLTGTPTKAGDATFTVVADNGISSVAMGSAHTITVSGTPRLTAETPPSAVAGVPYSYTFTASGTPAPFFEVTSGALPSGLTLAPTGVLAGTPTAAGESTFTVTAANGTGPTAVSSPTTLLVNVSVPSSVLVAPQSPGGMSFTAVIGSPITFEVAAKDAAGGIQPGQVAIYTLGTGSAMPGVVAGNAITFTHVGNHTITVWIGEVSTTIRVNVVAGPPAGIILSYIQTTATLGEPVSLIVSGTDAYGNDTGDLTGQADFSSDRPDDIVSGGTVTFSEPSPRLITASLGTLTATVGIQVAQPVTPADITPTPTATPSREKQAALADGGANPFPGISAALVLLAAALAATHIARVRRRRTHKNTG
jgi:hypothetical protein